MTILTNQWMEIRDGERDRAKMRLRRLRLHREGAGRDQEARAQLLQRSVC